jgi:hypothetical protein
LDHLEDEIIFSGELKKPGSLFTQNNYKAFLYPKALILTNLGKVEKVFRIGRFNSICCSLKKNNFYNSIIQKCNTKTNVHQFDFVVLPYIIEKFTVKSSDELDFWMDAFSKIDGCTVYKDEKKEENTLASIFGGAQYKIMKLEKREMIK